MSRWKAAGIHLGISFMIAALVGSVIYFLWYPPPYFTVAGGDMLILLIMGVDIVIGPLLTLVVFRAGKRGMKFDLTVIAALQVGAFCYGLVIIAAARPIFIVAESDRFVTVCAYQVDDADLVRASQPEFAARSWTGPRLVGAILADKNDWEVTKSALAGKDIDKMPKYYRPYSEVMDSLMGKAHPLSELATKDPRGEIARLVARLGEPMGDLAYLPLEGRTDSYTMVISRRSKQPVGVIAIDPW